MTRRLALMFADLAVLIASVGTPCAMLLELAS